MKSHSIALCGVLTALSISVMMLGSIIPGAALSAPILAMGALVPVLEELGPKAAGTAYAAVAILALLLVPDREAALVYVFFGWYPVVRPKIAAVPFKFLRVLLRLAVCNAAALVLYGVVLKIVGLPEDLVEYTWFFNVLLLVMGNGVFLLTDLTLARLTILWRIRLRKRFFR